MIWCLIGQSSSGKSTIESNLEKMGLSRVVSYTTRPKRENEVNGVDYHFVDTDTFVWMIEDGFFAETAMYRNWHYGLSLKEVDYINHDYIVVVTIHGYEELVKSVGRENVRAIHIKVEERERIIRQLKRGDDVDEVVRRIYTDREDFAGVEYICQYVVTNNDIAETTDIVHNIIKASAK